MLVQNIWVNSGNISGTILIAAIITGQVVFFKHLESDILNILCLKWLLILDSESLPDVICHHIGWPRSNRGVGHRDIIYLFLNSISFVVNWEDIIGPLLNCAIILSILVDTSGYPINLIVLRLNAAIAVAILWRELDVLLILVVLDPKRMDIISVLLRISPADTHSNAFELIVDCAVREEPVGVQVLKAQFSH